MGSSGFSHDVRKDLYFFDSGFMNALMYIEDILLNYTVPYMPFTRADSLFTPHNMHLEAAQNMFNFLEEVEIARFELPT